MTTTDKNSFSLSARNLYLVGILALLGVLCLLLFAPYINIIVIAFVLVELFHPLHKRINRQIQSSGLSAVISTLIAFVVVMVPISFIILITAGEALSFTRQAQQYVVANDLISAFPQQIADQINGFLSSLNVPPQYRVAPIDTGALVTELGNSLALTAGNIAGQLLAGGIGLLFQIFLLIVSMIYLFQLRQSLRSTISYFSPLDNDLDKLFFDKFIATTRAVIKGSVVVALMQATAVIIPMVLMGFVSPVLLWIIMVIASLVPVGSGIVWFPAGILMVLSGITSQNILLVAGGIFLVVYSAIIINVIEITVRPYVMKGATELHPMITLFSVLGGISLFGLIGVLYGPLITVFFISLMHVFHSEPRPHETIN